MIESDANVTLDLLERAKSKPDGVAVILEDQDISYRQLDRLVWQTAQYLQDQGVRAGEVIGTIFESEFKLLLALLGLMRLGATALPIPRSTTSFQKEEWLNLSGCRKLLTDQEVDERLLAASLHISMDTIVHTTRIHSAILQARPPASSMLITGSGSTGIPKLMPVSHAIHRNRFPIHNKAFAITEEEVLNQLTHLEYSSSIGRYLAFMHAGASMALTNNLRNENAIGAIFRRVTFFRSTVFHAETMLGNLAQVPRHDHLRVFNLGGSTVSANLRTRIQNSLTPNLYVHYAVNEVNIVTLCPPDLHGQQAGSIGFPVDNVQVEIEPTAGSPDVGAIRIKSPGCIAGYLNNPESTAQNFKDGWFYPGDLGKFGPSGELIFYGRGDQMMIMNGINIFPAEIERQISGLHGVKDVVAFPFRHPIHQDIPVCALTLEKSSPLNKETIMDYARNRLGFRFPREIFIMDDIPRNTMGKPIRKELYQNIVDMLKAREDNA